MDIPDFTQHASCLSFSKQVFSTHVSVVTSYSSTSATLVSSGSGDDLSIETPPQRNSECPTAIILAWQRPYRRFRFGVHLINKIKVLSFFSSISKIVLAIKMVLVYYSNFYAYCRVIKIRDASIFEDFMGTS